MIDETSRRAFLRVAGSAGAAWLIADAVWVRDALAHAIRQRSAPPPRLFQALSAPQAADVEAIAARIVPAVNDLPGATEAGVVHFIDRSLATFNAGQKPLFEEGLADLNRRARSRRRETPAFAALPAARQDQLLRSIESRPFFQAMRFATLAGMFAAPSWGGNRDHAGWILLDHDYQPAYQPPFGWYDDPAHRGG